MLDIPKDPKKIRARIRSYERKLRDEKRVFGMCRDGAGKRFFLAPLYMVMGDQEGALEAFRSYESEFPDDSGDPMHCLCWTLCLYRARETEGAAKKLHRTMLLNLYIIPLLLGEDYEWLNMWHGSNTAEPPWAEMTSPEFLALWTGAEKKWVANLYHGEELTEIRDRWIKIHKRLDHMPRGPERTRLCDEALTLET